jgi:colanic acid biosynthesis glycosyl transferase WcaI
MRICIVNEYFYPEDYGGTSTVLSTLTQELRKNHPNLSIDVVTSRNRYRSAGDKLAGYEEWNGIHIHRVAAPDSKGLGIARRLYANARFAISALAEMLRQPKYDLVLVGTAPPIVGLAAQAFKCLTKTPYVYIIYDLEPDRAVALGVVSDRNPVTRLLRVSQRGWMRSASKVIVLGRCMRDYIGRVYGLRPDQIRVIATGADPDEIQPVADRGGLRAKHDLDGFVVCYSGNFGRYHNFDTILDAAKELHRAATPVNFLMIGDGAQQEYIAERIANEGINNVRMMSYVSREDYVEIVTSVDASFVTLEPGMEGLCVPSKFYSILASGRPVVGLVSPRCEVAYVIHDEACGVQIDPSDTVGLVKALTDLSGNPERASRMGQNARAALVDNYSKEKVANKYYIEMVNALRGGAAIRTSRGNRRVDAQQRHAKENAAAVKLLTHK